MADRRTLAVGGLYSIAHVAVRSGPRARPGPFLPSSSPRDQRRPDDRELV